MVLMSSFSLTVLYAASSLSQCALYFLSLSATNSVRPTGTAFPDVALISIKSKLKPVAVATSQDHARSRCANVNGVIKAPHGTGVHTSNARIGVMIVVGLLCNCLQTGLPVGSKRKAYCLSVQSELWRWKHVRNTSCEPFCISFLAGTM